MDVSHVVKSVRSFYCTCSCQWYSVVVDEHIVCSRTVKLNTDGNECGVF